MLRLHIKRDWQSQYTNPKLTFSLGHQQHTDSRLFGLIIISCYVTGDGRDFRRARVRYKQLERRAQNENRASLC